MANYHLHTDCGSYLHIQKKTLENAIKVAKKRNYPIQISELKNEVFIIKYAHVPNDRDISGTNMEYSMLKHNVLANTI